MQWAFSKASWYGLIAAPASIILVIIMSAFHGSGDVPTRGLQIRAIRPEITIGPRSAGIQPLLVSLAPNGSVRPKIYIDSQLTPWDDFARGLQEGLNVRPPGRPVYLESAGDIDWGYAVETIDAIRGLHAVVILLPPTTAAVR